MFIQCHIDTSDDQEDLTGTVHTTTEYNSYYITLLYNDLNRSSTLPCFVKFLCIPQPHKFSNLSLLSLEITRPGKNTDLEKFPTYFWTKLAALRFQI
jgi:hypothetical protein